MSNCIVKLKKILTKNRCMLLHLLAAFNISKIPYLNCVTCSYKYNYVLNLDKLNCCKPCVKAGYSYNGYGLLIVVGE